MKIGGHRIELGEVESVLASHPRVRQAVVTVREDAPGDRRLVAYAVPLESPAPGLGAELRALVRERLPAYMFPAALVLLERFPPST